MSKMQEELELFSMSDFYNAAYGDTIVSQSSLNPFSFVEARQGAGDWSDAASSDLVLTTVLGGQARATIDVGAGAFRANGFPGELLLTPPKSSTNIQIDTDHRILLVGINFSELRERTPDAPLPTDGDFGRIHTGMFQIKSLHALMMEFWKDSFERPQWTPLEAEAAINAFAWTLVLCCRNYNGQQSIGGLAPWQVRKIRDALIEEPQQTLSDLASLVSMSPWHFCRAFKTATGTSPVRYRRALTIERARQALEKTDISITEIAFDLGYGSSQAFARAFRRQCGFPPHQYRQQRRN